MRSPLVRERCVHIQIVTPETPCAAHTHTHTHTRIQHARASCQPLAFAIKSLDLKVSGLSYHTCEVTPLLAINESKVQRVVVDAAAGASNSAGNRRAQSNVGQNPFPRSSIANTATPLQLQRQVPAPDHLRDQRMPEQGHHGLPRFCQEVHRLKRHDQAEELDRHVAPPPHHQDVGLARALARLHHPGLPPGVPEGCGQRGRVSVVVV